MFSPPYGEPIQLSFKLTFPCTNNMAEYEALLLGLELAIHMGAYTWGLSTRCERGLRGWGDDSGRSGTSSKRENPARTAASFAVSRKASSSSYSSGGRARGRHRLQEVILQDVWRARESTAWEREVTEASRNTIQEMEAADQEEEDFEPPRRQHSARAVEIDDPSKYSSHSLASTTKTSSSGRSLDTSSLSSTGASRFAIACPLIAFCGVQVRSALWEL